MAETYLDTTAAAEYMGVSRRWLELARHQGGSPPYVRISAKLIRYRQSDLDAWLAERLYGNTSEYPDADSAA